jgi:oligopeptide/dipeptide ABC transporter ATP-binding protein
MPLLEVDDLHVHFRVQGGEPGFFSGGRHTDLRAVDGVSLSIEQRAAVGIVGESGCGKSTLARTIVGLVQPTSGSLRFEGADLDARRDVTTRRRIQMVFQDPGSSLNPKLTVGQTLGELLRVHQLVPRSRVDERCRELLELVELSGEFLDSRPSRLSGGQRQRVGIARALAVEPDVLIADEAVAALDVSVQAAILNLLVGLKERLGLTLVFIAHDLAAVRNVCDRVAVMYLGRIVEEGETDSIFETPCHPYTRALLAAVPRFENRRLAGQASLPGEPPSPLHIPDGCRFHPRCVRAEARCGVDDPPMSARGDHRAACHFAWEGLGSPSRVASNS